MKNRRLLLSIFTLAIAMNAVADQFVNLTPRPRQMAVGEGSLALPASFGVGGTQLPDSISAEVARFEAAFNAAAVGHKCAVTTGSKGTLIRVTHNQDLLAELGAEGYRLDITPAGATVESATAAGTFYAFQTIKKLLPPSVMAGVPDSSVTTYELPCVQIADAPRFAYRGFMIDVSRHFFSINEVKRLLDIMAAYKLNRFHWHLTDDQGWRLPCQKYPLLTTVGATAPNCYITDMEYGRGYWTNQPYGPFAYTREELEDVVRYASERHIEVIPEVDMPGHFSAALTAYPEFSCWPDGKHEVKSFGGVYSDVLNVANPRAVQFAKDILDTLMDIFPYELIHIGGDECPTVAWESNNLCRQRMKELGLTHPRQLQSHFTKKMADYVARHGRRLAVWNEALSAEGTDVELVRSTDATVFCWVGAKEAARQAAKVGMRNVFTPIGPYYINRKQSTDPAEPTAAGDGRDNLELTYNTVPVPEGLTPAEQACYTGVQGTFWTEHVATPDYLEYLALPRLIAIAEAGWTPEEAKDFSHFVRRVQADAALLDYGHYQYGKHYMKKTENASR